MYTNYTYLRGGSVKSSFIDQDACQISLDLYSKHICVFPPPLVILVSIILDRKEMNVMVILLFLEMLS